MADHHMVDSTLSGREAFGWSGMALQAMAPIQGTITGFSAASQPSGTGAGQKARAQGSVGYFHWAPFPASSSRNTEVSILLFNLHGPWASGELQQSPAISIVLDVCIWHIAPNKSGKRSSSCPRPKTGKIYFFFPPPLFTLLTSFQSDMIQLS